MQTDLKSDKNLLHRIINVLPCDRALAEVEKMALATKRNFLHVFSDNLITVSSTKEFFLYS